MHEYRDFEPGSPLQSYRRVARNALFDSQRFFAAVAGSSRAFGPRSSWSRATPGSGVVALPTTLRLAGEIYTGLFGNSTGLRGSLLLATRRGVLARGVGVFRGLPRAVYVRRGALLASVGGALGRERIGLQDDLQGPGLHVGDLRDWLPCAVRGSPRRGVLRRLLQRYGGAAAHQTSTLRPMLAVALPWIFYLILNLALVLYGSFAGVAPVLGR